jgi:hypothetical protein
VVKVLITVDGTDLITISCTVLLDRVFPVSIVTPVSDKEEQNIFIKHRINQSNILSPLCKLMSDQEFKDVAKLSTPVSPT